MASRRVTAPSSTGRRSSKSSQQSETSGDDAQDYTANGMFANEPQFGPPAPAAPRVSPTTPQAANSVVSGAIVTAPVHIKGRNSAALTVEDIHTAFLSGLEFEAIEWARRGITASVDVGASPGLTPSSSSASLYSDGATAMRTPLSNGAQYDTFNQYPRVSTHSQQRTYSFYADCIPCPAYSANPFSFPLGLVMDTTNVRQQYVGQAPLISIVNLGAGLNGALGSVRQQLQHVWRNIIRVEIADQHVSHLRIIGCGLSINTTALSDEQRRRGFLAVELTITLMAERDAPSSSLSPLGAQKRTPDKGIAHCYESS